MHLIHPNPRTQKQKERVGVGEKNIGKNRGTKMSENLYLDTRNYNIYLARTLVKKSLKAYVQTQEIIIYITHSQPEILNFLVAEGLDKGKLFRNILSFSKTNMHM